MLATIWVCRVLAFTALNMIIYLRSFVGAPIVYVNGNELIGIGSAITASVTMRKLNVHFLFLI